AGQCIGVLPAKVKILEERICKSEFPPLAFRQPDILRNEKRVQLNQVSKPIPEIPCGHLQLVLQKPLLNSDIEALTLFWLESRIAKTRKEQVINRRSVKAGPKAASELGAHVW